MRETAGSHPGQAPSMQGLQSFNHFNHYRLGSTSRFLVEQQTSDRLSTPLRTAPDPALAAATASVALGSEASDSNRGGGEPRADLKTGEGSRASLHFARPALSVLSVSRASGSGPGGGEFLNRILYRGPRLKARTV